MENSTRIKFALIMGHIKCIAEYTDELEGDFKHTVKGYLSDFQKKAHRVERFIQKNYYDTKKSQEAMDAIVNVLASAGDNIIIEFENSIEKNDKKK